MRSHRPLILWGIALAFAMGCSRRPTKEIAKARNRLAESERAEAPVYAPASFEEARRTLREAEHLSGERKFADARIIALESEAHARSAIALTAENRKKMLDALNMNLESTGRDLAGVSREIERAASLHVEPEKLELFRRDLARAQAALEDARRLSTKGDLPNGKKSSQDARIAADNVLREIGFAIADHSLSHPAPKKIRRSRPRS